MLKVSDAHISRLFEKVNKELRNCQFYAAYKIESFELSNK